ncbi:MAG: packaged DNA stabilization gp4 family protein [Aeromonadaceae bacterium]
MSKTKGDIALLALRRAGIASSATLTQPEPASVGDALEDLELMMAQWLADGIDIGYLPTDPPQPDDESGLELWAVEPVALKLAEKVLIDNLRPVPDALASQIQRGYELICSQVAIIPSLVRRNDMPVGAGNKPWFGGRDRFYIEEDGSAT